MTQDTYDQSAEDVAAAAKKRRNKDLDKLRADWNSAKDRRDRDCAAAWELPDVAARVPAYEAARARWNAEKAVLLEREAAIRAG